VHNTPTDIHTRKSIDKNKKNHEEKEMRDCAVATKQQSESRQYHHLIVESNNKTTIFLCFLYTHIHT
jgi:hypothetical protein